MQRSRRKSGLTMGNLRRRSADRERSEAVEDAGLLLDDANPYLVTTTDPWRGKRRGSRDNRRMRVILYTHLGTIIAAVAVIRSETILSDRLLESAVVFPFISTLYICPISMCVAAMRRKDRTRTFWACAVLVDLALSVLQVWIWLPTVQ